jgi:hypothetical protein
VFVREFARRLTGVPASMMQTESSPLALHALCFRLWLFYRGL